MTQSLLNLMDSPSAVIALILWVILIFLAIGQCRKWKKSERSEKIFYQNHPAIPMKEYKLSELAGCTLEETKLSSKIVGKLKKPKLNAEQKKECLDTLKHVWDV